METLGGNARGLEGNIFFLNGRSERPKEKETTQGQVRWGGEGIERKGCWRLITKRPGTSLPHLSIGEFVGS